MRALIIGGGIGGPIAAAAMQRAGIEPIVFEEHDGPAEFLGLFLGLGVNGMRVLRELDLLEKVMQAGVIPTPRLEFSSTTGKRLGVVSNGWLDPDAPSITLMRGSLQRALADAAHARGVGIRYGHRFTDYSAGRDGVVARFADGTEVKGDILVGADGIHSRVRRTMLPDAPGPSYTGLLNLGGVVRQSGLPATPDTIHMVWGTRAFFGYTVRQDGEAWWFANVGEDREPARGELTRVPTGEWRHRLQSLFSEDPRFIGEMVGRTDRIGASPIHDMPALPSWHRGRTVLLGDAAHAVSPSAGQGASLAMEDAIVLAKCLRDIRDPGAALASYEQLRRARAEKIVAMGRRRGNYKAPKSRAAVFLRDALMPLAFRFFATEKAMAWIYDHEIRWDEPVTRCAA